MIYIGVSNVPSNLIGNAIDLLRWDIEYFNGWDIQIYTITDVSEFKIYPKHRAINGLEEQNLPWNVIYGCIKARWTGGETRFRSEWTLGKYGLLQNFRKAWPQGTQVVGHWKDLDRVKKWAQGGISLPKGGMEQDKWVIDGFPCDSMGAAIAATNGLSPSLRDNSDFSYLVT